ncbi:MAG: hypothetical protein WC480_05245 [Patescibacteria group bacterium]
MLELKIKNIYNKLDNIKQLVELSKKINIIDGDGRGLPSDLDEINKICSPNPNIDSYNSIKYANKELRQNFNILKDIEDEISNIEDLSPDRGKELRTKFEDEKQKLKEIS